MGRSDPRAGIGRNTPSSAIAFDLDDASANIRKARDAHDVDWRQGSTSFGGESVTPVTCFLAAEDLTEH